jgi:queuine tRNA-ribosyltransferase subunit QTRTD1
VDLLPREARAFQVSLVHFMDHLGPDHVGNNPGGGRRYFGCKPTCMLATPRDPITFDMVGEGNRGEGGGGRWLFVRGPYTSV